MTHKGSMTTVTVVAGREIIDDFAGAASEPYVVPRWLAKLVRGRRHDFATDADRLAVCLALLYPDDLVPTRGEIAYFASAACSAVDLPVTEEMIPTVLKRAADAAEDLFIRRYRIPRATITILREARGVLTELRKDLCPTIPKSTSSVSAFPLATL